MKDSESSTKIEPVPMASQMPVGRSNHSTRGSVGETGHLLGSYSGSIPAGDSEFFFVPRSWQMNMASLAFIHRAKYSPSFILLPNFSVRENIIIIRSNRNIGEALQLVLRFIHLIYAKIRLHFAVQLVPALFKRYRSDALRLTRGSFSAGTCHAYAGRC